MMANGIYLVRFRSKESCEKVLNAGPLLFDSRPVVIKRWEPGIILENEKISKVLVWIRLPGLHLKFWGQNSLIKIGSLIGKPIKTDKIIATKERLEYARLMVEVTIDGVMPEEIEFMDENGHIVLEKVVYELKPVTCSKCENMGHSDVHCPNLNRTKRDRYKDGT